MKKNNIQYININIELIILTCLFKKSVYSACLDNPVLIIIVWKHCRSIAHNWQSVAAVIVAVLLQLYKIANSPSTLTGANVLRYFPSRDTSTFPSENGKTTNIVNKYNKKNVLYSNYILYWNTIMEYDDINTRIWVVYKYIYIRKNTSVIVFQLSLENIVNTPENSGALTLFKYFQMHFYINLLVHYEIIK